MFRIENQEKLESTIIMRVAMNAEGKVFKEFISPWQKNLKRDSEKNDLDRLGASIQANAAKASRNQ